MFLHFLGFNCEAFGGGTITWQGGMATLTETNDVRVRGPTKAPQAAVQPPARRSRSPAEQGRARGAQVCRGRRVGREQGRAGGGRGPHGGAAGRGEGGDRRRMAHAAGMPAPWGLQPTGTRQRSAGTRVPNSSLDRTRSIGSGERQVGQPK